MSQKPEELSHEQYCPFCYTSKVQPTIRRYNEILRRAKVVIFIDTARRKPLPLLEKSKDPILVQDCTDREETILRLAFLAAEKGYNAVIKASVDHKKVRNFGYQKMSWHGNGFPAQLDSAKLERQEE
ncbi:MAG: hypothetical protein SGI74_03335 [Oligoflexia bacterium]|nr:hypothetical protein [Oligoflexia bacterium]